MRSELSPRLYIESHCYHDFPHQKTINKLFEEQALLSPHAIALISEGREFSYTEINSLANQISRFLLAHMDIKKEDKVVLCLEKSALMVISTLAIFKCRMIFIPVEPSWPKARIEKLLEDVKPKFVVTSSNLSESFSRWSSLFFIDELTNLLSEFSTENVDLPQSGNDLAYLIYSSGTTGKPKGILGEHRNIISRFAWSWNDFPFQPNDRCVFSPAFATIESIWVMFGSLSKGIPLIIPNENQQKEISNFVQLLIDQNITRIELIPSTLRLLLNQYPDLVSRLPKLRLWDVSGEVLDREIVAQFFASGKKTRLINRMGASEASSFLFHEVSPLDLDCQRIPIGKPTTNTTLMILDDKQKPVERGMIGELYVTGPRVVRGYLNDSELTAKKFIENPFQMPYPYSKILYRTGDLVRENQTGNLEYIGREDFQIKVRGFRVNLNEIERTLKEHAQVVNAVVLALEESGETILSAFIQSDQEFSIKSKQALALRKFLLKRLPLVSVPTEFTFLKNFPLTRGGKIDRHGLKENYYDPVQPQDDYAIPTDDIEKVLCNIWEKVLCYDRIGIDDAFTNLAGDSIKCAKILVLIHESFPVNIKFSDIFVYQTIRKLATLIRKKNQNVVKEEKLLSIPPELNLIPLSPRQKQLIFLHETQLNPALYNLHSTFEIEGHLDILRLEQAIKFLLAKHILLRSKVVHRQDDYFFEIEPLEKFNLYSTFHDHENIQDEIFTPFDLYEGPLFKIKLFQSHDQKWVLLFLIHHMISDEWSFQILHREISDFYNFGAGKDSIQQSFIPQVYKLSENDEKRLVNFWKNNLQGANFLIALPFDFPRPEKPLFKGSVHRLEIPKQISGAIASFCSQTKGTLFTALLAALQLFLHKLTDQKDLIVGIPSSSRNESCLLDSIGYFVNALPIRSTYYPSETLVNKHEKVQSAVYQAKENQDLSFDQIVNAVSEAGLLNVNPLFQVWFNLEELENYDNLDLKGVSSKYLTIPTQFSKFDLSFIAKSLYGRLIIEIEFSTELFKASSIAKLSDHLLTFFEHLFKNPEEILATKYVLNPDYEEKLLEEMTCLSSLDIHSSIDKHIQKASIENPDKVAVIYEEMEMTYRILHERSEAIARYFLSITHPQSILGVCLEPSPFLIELLIGLIKAGICFVPIDPNTPEERMARMLETANVKIIVCNHTKSIKNLMFVSQSDLEPYLHLGKDLTPLEIPQTGRAYVIFTSGSTGEPKGVVVSRGNLTNALMHMNQTLGINQNSRFLLNTTISFDISLLELFSTLMVGGTLVIPSLAILRDGLRLSHFAKKLHLNYLQATPSNWKLLIEGGLLKNSALNLICGGEKLEPTLADKLIELGKNVWNMYGPTETTIWSSYKKITSGKDVSAGKPLGNTSIFILDTDQNIMPQGMIGEIAIAGEGVSQGYFNKPEMTVQRYFCSPLSNFSNLYVYKTGDRGRINGDCELECLGREDRQAKIHGHRIELTEIENLLQKLPVVNHAYVTTYIDHAGFKEIVAYIEPRAQLDLSKVELEHQIAEELRRHLPSYMHPNLTLFLDEFPLTLNKKVDYKKLPKPIPYLSKDSKFNPPVTELEKEIAATWSEVLGISEISTKANFFTLGGHSLIAMRVTNQLSDKLNIELPAATLFDYPTVETLSQYISQKTRSNVPRRALDIAHINTLSEEQKGFWLIQKLYPDLALYNISFPFIVKFPFDKQLIKHAFQIIFNTYDVLHFIVEENNYEIGSKAYKGPLPYFEGHSIDYMKCVKEEAHKPFRLSVDPPIRLLCCDLGSNTFMIQFTFHHIAVDRASFPIFFQQFSHTLDLLSQSKVYSNNLKKPIQYSEYARWQQDELTAAKEEVYFKFWENYLEHSSHVSFPLDNQRNAIPSMRGAKFAISLNKNVAEFAREKQTTPYLIFLGLFYSLLYRYTSQNDLIIGTPVSCRLRAEFQDMIGCFVNTIPVRLFIDESTSFLNLINSLKENFPILLKHAQLPFHKLIKKLNLEKQANSHPLFQILFVYEEDQNNQLTLLNEKVQLIDFNTQFAHFDLVFAVKEKESHFEIEIQYAADLFFEETIERLCKHFSFLSNQLIKDPNVLIAHQELLDPAEKKKITFEWNDRDIPYPKQCVHKFFEEHVNLNPDAIALVYENESISYHHLNERSNQLAHYLISQGLHLESFVGVCLDRSIDQIVALLAILKSGGCFVPIDPNFPEERIKYILRETNLKSIISNLDFIHKFNLGQTVKEHKLSIINIEQDEEGIVKCNKQNCSLQLSPRQLAYIIYTSGSTGQPKGVLIEHLGLANLVGAKAKATQLKIEVGTRVLQLASTTFDASIWDWVGSLSLGATLFMAKKENLIPGIPLSETLQRYHINYFNIPSGALELLPQENLPDLKVLMAIGDVCSKKTMAYWSSKTRLFNGYGPTECTIGCMMNRISQNSFHRDIGYPLPNIQTYILDKFLLPTTIGVTGELYIGGDGLARGYLSDPRLTSERFTANPFGPVNSTSSNRLYRTGDLVRYKPKGTVEFIGRTDTQIKIRGFRVDINEIVAILNQHPKVEKAFVRIIEKEAGHKSLSAYAVISDRFLEDQEVIISELKRNMKKTLPAFMIPQFIHILDKIPLNKNGKIEYEKLPNPLISNSNLVETKYAKLNNSIEWEVASSFKDVLHCQNCGIDGNFFELGGHSLAASQLLFNLNDKFKVNLTLKDIFDYPTIKELASLLKGMDSSKEKISIKKNRSPLFQLSNAQKRLWLLEVLLEQKGLYNVPLAFEVTGLLDLRTLQHAINKIVQRHENLRLSLVIKENIPFQKIFPSASFRPQIQSLDCLKIDLIEMCQALSSKPFNLETEFFFRCYQIRTEQNTQVILFVFHHLIVDGQSIHLFIKELNHLVHLKTLPPLKNRYRDFVMHQTTSANSLEEKTLFWENYLDGYQGILELPTDYPHPNTPLLTAARHQCIIDQETTQKLRELIKQAKVTLNTACLAIFKLFLNKISFQNDLVVGCPFSLRESQEWSDVMGYFINSLPVRTKVNEIVSFTDMLDQTWQNILSVEKNKQLPFEKILRVADKERSSAAKPLIQVWFVLENLDEYPDLNLEGLQTKHLSIPQKYAKFNLMLIVEEKKNEISLTFEYADQLFSAHTIEKWSKDILKLIQDILSDPTKDIKQYRLENKEMSILI